MKRCSMRRGEASRLAKEAPTAFNLFQARIAPEGTRQ
jgi:hypothetical protein